MTWIVVKMVVSLIAVLALMLGLVAVMKKFLSPAGRDGGAAIDIDVVGHRTLQPKRTVYAIRVANKIVVVGSTEHGMQTLTEIGDPAVLADVESRLAEAVPSPRWMTWTGRGSGRVSFAAYLRKNLSSMGGRGGQ